jgi:hypothetical protein
VISLQVGDCWLWSLIIFLIQRFVLAVLGPHSLMGGVGGLSPPTMSPGGSRGVGTIFVAPPGGGFGGNTPEAKYWENCLVKYCNFVVNLDRSL